MWDLLKTLFRKLSGAEERERRAIAERILAEHDTRDNFNAPEAMRRLMAEMPQDVAGRFFTAHCVPRIGRVVAEAIADRLLSPEDDAKIAAIRERYGNIAIDEESNRLLELARSDWKLWEPPLEPIETTLLLNRGEWCAYQREVTAAQDKVHVTGRYRATTVQNPIFDIASHTEGTYTREGYSYRHSFGKGLLGATSERLLWVSPDQALSIPLYDILSYTARANGLKVIRGSGDPVYFLFGEEDRTAMVRFGKAIEELR